MKTSTKKRIAFGAAAAVIVLAIGCFSIWSIMNAQEEAPRLTESQIAQLREQYPICGINEPPLVSMGQSTVEEIKERAESFVYGEVIGDYTFYYVNGTTGHEELDAKRKANGINDVYEFYEYTVKILDDTEGKYTKGEEITIAANTMFMDYNPKLSDGMRVVVPVVRDEEKPSRSHYSVSGLYYVTEDGYVLSAFDEATRAQKANSGITVEQLFKELKK